MVAIISVLSGIGGGGYLIKLKFFEINGLLSKTQNLLIRSQSFKSLNKVDSLLQIILPTHWS